MAIREDDAMRKRKRQWVWAPKHVRALPTEREKTEIVAACDKFVADVLKLRFLPEIRPTKYNYVVNLFGKWHGGRYRFIQRLRSDDPDAIAGSSMIRLHASTISVLVVST
jgi:hypothetical protein